MRYKWNEIFMRTKTKIKIETIKKSSVFPAPKKYFIIRREKNSGNTNYKCLLDYQYTRYLLITRHRYSTYYYTTEILSKEYKYLPWNMSNIRIIYNINNFHSLNEMKIIISITFYGKTGTDNSRFTVDILSICTTFNHLR